MSDQVALFRASRSHMQASADQRRMSFPATSLPRNMPKNRAVRLPIQTFPWSGP